MGEIEGGGIVVDTTVWVDFYRGRRTLQTDWLLRESNRQDVITLDLVLCELLQGTKEDREFQLIQRELMEMDFHSAGGFGIAVESARNYVSLRARGITVRKTIDCMIATYCILHGYALLHNDRDFDPFEQFLGLRVVHPVPPVVQ